MFRVRKLRATYFFLTFLLVVFPAAVFLVAFFLVERLAVFPAVFPAAFFVLVFFLVERFVVPPWVVAFRLVERLAVVFFAVFFLVAISVGSSRASIREGCLSLGALQGKDISNLCSRSASHHRLAIKSVHADESKLFLNGFTCC